MTRKINLIGKLFILVALFAPFDVWAENSHGQKTITVASLVNEVLSHNPELKFYEAQMNIAQGERTTAEEWANPDFSSTLGNKHLAGGDDGMSWSLSITQTFEWPGRRTLPRLIADNEIERAVLELAKFRSALTLEVRTAIFDLLEAQDRVSAIKEITDRYKELADVLSKREVPGINPLLERRIIEATGFALSRKIVEAEIEIRKSRFRINELRGEPFESSFQIKSSKFELKEPPSLNVLVEAAQKNNSELQIKELELKLQGLKLDLIRNEQNPAFAVGPYMSNESAGDVETQVGIGVSIPLPLWNRNEGRISTEAARREQAESSLHLHERLIKREIAESCEIYKLRLADLKKSNGLSIDDFKKAAALADENYRLGAVPLTTYVELQKQYLDVLEATLEIKRDALRAKHNLEQLTGLDLDSPDSLPSLEKGGKND